MHVVYALLFLLLSTGLFPLCAQRSTSIYTVESAYYADNYSQTLISAAQLLKNRPSKRPQLIQFFKDNNPSLSQHLLNSLTHAPLSIKQRNHLQPLDAALRSLTPLLQESIPSQTITTLAAAIAARKTDYLTHASQDSTRFQKAQQPRKAYRILTSTCEQIPCSPVLLKQKDALSKQLATRLFISRPLVHDDTITALEQKTTLPLMDRFTDRPSHLLIETIPIPQTVHHHLNYSLNTLKTPHLSISTPTPTPHFTLIYSVGFSIEKNNVATREDIQDTFLVQHTPNDSWQEQSVLYEKWVQRTVYKASIDAVVYDTLTAEPYGHFLFETHLPHDQEWAGKLITPPSTFAAVQHSKAYTRLTTPTHTREATYYVNQALQDAAETLAAKILHTIDTDTPPYPLYSRP